jgi:hypothetical protein
MFKKLLFVSLLISVLLTAWFYLNWIRPRVDVTAVEASAAFSMDGQMEADENDVILLHGKISGAGMNLLGKPELSLSDSSGMRMVPVTLVSGHPSDMLIVGTMITVKGLWEPIGASDGVMTIPGRLTDAIVTEH